MTSRYSCTYTQATKTPTRGSENRLSLVFCSLSSCVFLVRCFWSAILYANKCRRIIMPFTTHSFRNSLNLTKRAYLTAFCLSPNCLLRILSFFRHLWYSTFFNLLWAFVPFLLFWKIFLYNKIRQHSHKTNLYFPIYSLTFGFSQTRGMKSFSVHFHCVPVNLRLMSRCTCE